MVEGKIKVSEGAAVWISIFASAAFGGRGSSMASLRDFYVIVDFSQYTLRGLYMTRRLCTSFLV
jgi:hypothetical protein